MPKYIPYDYNQSSMVVINYLDQLVSVTRTPHSSFS